MVYNFGMVSSIFNLYKKKRATSKAQEMHQIYVRTFGNASKIPWRRFEKHPKGIGKPVSVRYHSGGSMELNTCILLLALMVSL